jgi:hypothetical protein
LSRVVTAELGFLLSANARLRRRRWRVGRNPAFKWKGIGPPTGFLVIDSMTNTVQLVHQKVELVLYFFQTVFFAYHDLLSGRNTETGGRDSYEQN